MPSTRTDKVRDALALAVLAALSVSYLVAARAKIVASLATPAGVRTFTASDSRHYLDIAEELGRGDWSFAYVAPTGGPDRAHRQPLYPTLLAAAMRVQGRDLGALATLNVVLVIASMWVAYAIGKHVLGSRIAGVAGAVVVWRVPFLWDNATTRLLTEPGYVLLTLVLALCFLSYSSSRRAGWLYATAVVAALCYLQRVNGLFTAVLTLIALALIDFGRVASRHSGSRAEFFTRHAIALFLFVVVAAPGWLPRLVHAGNPLYHGYLPNFVWVDEYQRAHVPGPRRYGWRDYASEHDVGDAAARMRYGLYRALWSAPREKYGDLVAACMLAGVVVTLWARKWPLLSWYAIGLIGVLPLAWTAMSNPVRRIPATALLAFGVVAVAAGAAVAIGIASAALARARDEPSEKPPENW